MCLSYYFYFGQLAEERRTQNQFINIMSFNCSFTSGFLEVKQNNGCFVFWPHWIFTSVNSCKRIISNAGSYLASIHQRIDSMAKTWATWRHPLMYLRTQPSHGVTAKYNPFWNCEISSSKPPGKQWKLHRLHASLLHSVCYKSPRKYINHTIVTFPYLLPRSQYKHRTSIHFSLLPYFTSKDRLMISCHVCVFLHNFWNNGRIFMELVMNKYYLRPSSLRICNSLHSTIPTWWSCKLLMWEYY